MLLKISWFILCVENRTFDNKRVMIWIFVSVWGLLLSLNFSKIIDLFMMPSDVLNVLWEKVRVWMQRPVVGTVTGWSFTSTVRVNMWTRYYCISQVMWRLLTGQSGWWVSLFLILKWIFVLLLFGCYFRLLCLTSPVGFSVLPILSDRGHCVLGNTLSLRKKLMPLLWPVPNFSKNAWRVCLGTWWFHFCLDIHCELWDLCICICMYVYLNYVQSAKFATGGVLLNLTHVKKT